MVVTKDRRLLHQPCAVVVVWRRGGETIAVRNCLK